MCSRQSIEVRFESAADDQEIFDEAAEHGPRRHRQLEVGRRDVTAFNLLRKFCLRISQTREVLLKGKAQYS